MSLKPRTGGQILIDQLVIHGANHLFCVPGESYLVALDAMHDSSIEVTVCRQEGGAAMMAEAYGKLTGRPGDPASSPRGPAAGWPQSPCGGIRSRCSSLLPRTIRSR
jgi:acetolactate synthase-1/2/3 large subunit